MTSSTSIGAKIPGLVSAHIVAINGTEQDRPNSHRAAVLAQYRRGLGKPAGSVPTMWAVELAPLHEEREEGQRCVDYAEQAIHDALCLYAMHQQSKSAPMHITGRRFGRAVGDLIAAAGQDFADGPLRRRFNAAVASKDGRELAIRIRGLISLLREAEIALDYGRLAADLYWFNFPRGSDSVRLAWGRALYSKPSNSSEA